ncbi:helix-turn-helix domain-containing protein [Laribacter hongkongensis]|nr:helix-turn-helix domain-containing protein [Laribacter hongkongensis]
METIREALKAHEGNISATARALGISRQTVMRARRGSL